MWTGAPAEGVTAPRRYRYMQFAGPCVAIFGASIGLIHDDGLRWVIWALTAVVALFLFISGERGVRRWKIHFETHASSDQEAQQDRVRIRNRFQVTHVLLSVIAFIGVLFVPVSPLARAGIWIILVAGLGFVLAKATIPR